MQKSEKILGCNEKSLYLTGQAISRAGGKEFQQEVDSLKAKGSIGTAEGKHELQFVS